MEALARLHGRIGFIDHICNDPECGCQKDETLKAMRGKWILELHMLDPKTNKPLKAPLMMGPFESEELAKNALDNVAKDAQKVLAEQGVALRESNKKVFNPMRVNRG